MMDLRNFFAELKRRNVYKVAVAYAVVAWLLIQIATQVFPFFEIPNWAVRLVVLLSALGFPVALILAWAFELTPEGIRRTEHLDVTPGQRSGNRAWIYVVIFGVLISVGLFFAGRYSAPDRTTSGSSEKSIAVLPFANQSGDPAQEYFSDGLTEELINGLGQIPELRVIGRNSSFHFKGKGGDSRVIGQALGVAHLLEGSVRKAGDRVRIGVQLVDTMDGSQRWSDTYNRELKDIFAVQEEIAKAVAEQLRVRLLGDAVTSKPSNQNIAAYNAFLQAKFYYDKLNNEAAAQAIRFADEAIRLDPNYAEAYVLKARALYLIGASQGLQGRDKFEQAGASARAALALRPDLSDAHSAMAYVHLYADWNLAAAEAELAAAHDRNPTFLNNLANVRGIQGRSEESLALRKEAVRLDPLHAMFYYNLGNSLMRLGRLDQAEAAFRKALELQPTVQSVRASLCIVAILRGDREAALREAELEPLPLMRAFAIALARFARGERQEADAALERYIAQAAERVPSTIAAVYAFRGEADKMMQWLEQAYEQREPNIIAIIPLTPFFMRYNSDPRFVELCNKIGIPVPQ